MAADLWASARTQLGLFEQRSSELSLVLNTEKASLSAVQQEVKQLEQGEFERVRRRAPVVERRFALNLPASLLTFEGSFDLSHLYAERGGFSKRKTEAEGKKAVALAALAQLRAEADRAGKDSAVLQKHLELLRASCQDASTRMEADRQRYAQHVTQLRAQLEEFRAHVN